MKLCRQPKFPKAKYDGFTMPSQDMEDEVVIQYSRLVKCRKEHKCSWCGATINKGDYAVYEKGFLDGKPVSVHDCLDCVEDEIRGWGDAAQRRWEKRAKQSGFLN